MAANRTRVQVRGSIGKSIRFPTGVSGAGATLGVDFKLPDGSVPTLQQLAAALVTGAATQDNPGNINPGIGGTPLVWQNIQYVPPQVIYPARHVFHEDDAGEDYHRMAVPGPIGLRGLPGFDARFPEDAEDSLTVPGPKGDQGFPGIPGVGYFVPDDPDDQLMLSAIPTGFGPAIFNGEVVINGAPSQAGRPSALYLNGFAEAVVSANAAAATNHSIFRAQQAGFTAGQFGVDGGNSLITDSANSDMCFVSNGHVQRWGTGSPPTPTQMSLQTSGALTLKTSPLSSIVTQVASGLANFKSAATTSANATLTTDASLTVTCNETGWYDIDIYLPTFEATSGAGGFQCDLNGGSATIANYTAAVPTSSSLMPGITSITAVTSLGTVNTSSTAPSWIRLSGTLQVTVVGTIAVRWAQNSTLAIDPTTLMAGASIVLTKIG